MYAKLNLSIYRGFYRTLLGQCGALQTKTIWNNADIRYIGMLKKHSFLDSDSKMMLLPALALYEELQLYFPKESSLQLLIEYGDQFGRKIAKAVHMITSIPYVSMLLWHNMPKLMKNMSNPAKGYSRQIISETPELVGVDILSCPLHNASVHLGAPEIARIVCAMDKAYMSGFRHINYTRTTSVAEGDRCCDYRLSWNKDKSE